MVHSVVARGSVRRVHRSLYKPRTAHRGHLTEEHEHDANARRIQQWNAAEYPRHDSFVEWTLDELNGENRESKPGDTAQKLSGDADAWHQDAAKYHQRPVPQIPRVGNTADAREGRRRECT